MRIVKNAWKVIFKDQGGCVQVFEYRLGDPPFSVLILGDQLYHRDFKTQAAAIKYAKSIKFVTNPPKKRKAKAKRTKT